MKKAIMFVAVSAFVGLTTLTASADNTIPGAYNQANSAGIGVNQTIMQIGAKDRLLTNAVNLASGAGNSRSDTGPINRDFQFGSSQTEQSWKAAKTVEEAQVRGLVPGDCRGDNSDGAYRQAMNQNRNGFRAEKLVSQADCEINHATLR
jgi:hypothetical protein